MEVITITTEFEFRLIDGRAPDGQLEADDLIAIVQSLKEVATKLGRAETAGEALGRPSKRAQHIAKLTIGLAPGSTRVLVRRAATGENALDFDFEEESSFDDKFEALVECIAADERPQWMPAALATAAGKLRTALENAAPTVEFSAAGQRRRTFETATTHRETWLVPDPQPDPVAVTFVGRLRAVNLDSHRYQVTDDVGNKVSLVDVETDARIGRLLDEYVSVEGSPERDAKGRLSHIHGPVIEAAAAPLGTVGVRENVPLDEILARAAGPITGGIPDLSDEEAQSFLTAIGL